MKHEIPAMLAGGGGGAVVTTSSGAGVVGISGQAASVAAEHGLFKATLSLVFATSAFSPLTRLIAFCS